MCCHSPLLVTFRAGHATLVQELWFGGHSAAAASPLQRATKKEEACMKHRRAARETCLSANMFFARESAPAPVCRNGLSSNWRRCNTSTRSMWAIKVHIGKCWQMHRLQPACSSCPSSHEHGTRSCRRAPSGASWQLKTSFLSRCENMTAFEPEWTVRRFLKKA